MCCTLCHLSICLSGLQLGEERKALENPINTIVTYAMCNLWTSFEFRVRRPHIVETGNVQ